MLAGLDLQDVWPLCNGAIGCDAQKLRCLCLDFVSTKSDEQLVTMSRGEDEKQTLVRKRKRENLEADLSMTDAGPRFRHVSQVRFFQPQSNTVNYLKPA